MHSEFMKAALEQARQALDMGEVPVGAVVVKDGEIIAAAHNLVERKADSLGAQQLPHTRSFPCALLPSRDVCSWLGPAPACLGSLPEPQLRASSP